MMGEKHIALHGAQRGASTRAMRAGAPKSPHGIGPADLRAMCARVSGPSHGGVFAMLSMHCLVVALSAFAAFAVCSGCSREAEPEPATPYFDRTKEPEYKKEIDALRKEQSEINARAAAVARELAEARAADPNSAKTKELEKTQKSVAEKLEKYRARSMMAIREWKLKEQEQNKKK